MIPIVVVVVLAVVDHSNDDENGSFLGGAAEVWKRPERNQYW
jgi:hypothetical protein